MPTTPPSITALPTPPDPNDRASFNARAYPWSVAQQTLATEVGSVAANVYANAGEAATSAGTATTQAGVATTQASAAAASAASAINAPGTNATSTTSLALTAGAKAWTIQTGKLFPPGVPVFLASASNPAVNRMYGILGTHDNTTGACTATMTPDPGASGTHTDWIMGIGVSLAGTVSLPRVARTSNTALTVAEKGKLIDITSGSFAQTTDTAGTLGADWFAYLTNTGTGVPTYSTTSLPQGALILLHSDGTTVRSYIMRIPEQVSIFRDEKPSGTNGGTGTATTWVQRDINTTSINAIQGASLSSNQVTLPAGTFSIRASAPCAVAASHVLRLYNITAGAVVALGTAERSIASSSSRSFVNCSLTLGASAVLRLDHWLSAAGSANDLGNNAGTGSPNVFTEIEIKRVA